MHGCPAKWIAMKNLLLLMTIVAVFSGTTPRAAASDLFERHDFTVVKDGIGQLTAVPKISLQDAAKLKPLSASISSPCVLIRTSEGNIAKALLSWGYRKGAGDKTVPVLLIERYVTYRTDRPDLTAAAGKEVMVFGGFEFDFDIGQVVPAGIGGDISFSAESVLAPVAPSEILPLNGSLIPRTEAGRGNASTTADFTGRWKINADDRWNGEWVLSVDETGKITGKYVSDESKSSYDITGAKGATPNQAKLEIFLANAQMSAEIYLWTREPNRLAGTVTIAGRKFGVCGERLPDEAQ